MKRVSLIFFISVIAHTWVFSQQNIILKGVVKDTTGAGVPFAHVGICGKAIGTVTNENGEFQLILASYLAHDTLCVSSIGFGTFQGPIAEVRKNKFITIRLIPEVRILGELIVSGEKITAKKILENAISRIKKNYPVRPFILDGYYRDYLKKDNDYVSFLESAVSLEDPGFNKAGSKAKLRINQIRFNPKYEANFEKYCTKAKSDTVKEIMEGFSPFINGNEFTNLMYNNPIRNYNQDIPIIGVFNQFYMKNLKFELSYNMDENGKEVYVISFEPVDSLHYKYVQVFGEIYVRTVDYAILKFSYNYYVSLFRERKKLYQLDVEYRGMDGKMFLKYISFINYFKIYTGDEIAELYQYREFFVNDIHYPKFTPFKDDEIISNNEPLHEFKMKSDPDFWNNYNMVLLEKPLKE